MTLTAHFLSVLDDVVPRVAGLCDRAESSATFGCFDRNYWHYRLIDLPNARFQEAAWLIALAWDTERPGNRFYRARAVESWVRAAWRFWLDRRNRDGSVAEIYPNERSFCATSFSMVALCESIMMLGGVGAWRAEIERTTNTAYWLARATADAPANQVAACAHALHLYALITADPAVMRAANEKLDELLRLEAEGVFLEYGGFDAGYQSITLATLNRIVRYLPEHRKLTEAIDRGRRKLDSVIGDNGRIDALVNSRSTQFLYPSGLNFAGGSGLKRLAAGLDRNCVLRPAWMDDRFCIAMASDYLLAAKEIDPC